MKQPSGRSPVLGATGQMKNPDSKEEILDLLTLLEGGGYTLAEHLKKEHR